MSECGPEGPVIAREGRNVDCLIDFTSLRNAALRIGTEILFVRNEQKDWSV